MDYVEDKDTAVADLSSCQAPPTVDTHAPHLCVRVHAHIGAPHFSVPPAVKHLRVRGFKVGGGSKQSPMGRSRNKEKVGLYSY